MSKMSELSVLLGEIINTGSSLLKALTAVRESLHQERLAPLSLHLLAHGQP